MQTLQNVRICCPLFCVSVNWSNWACGLSFWTEQDVWKISIAFWELLTGVFFFASSLLNNKSDDSQICISFLSLEAKIYQLNQNLHEHYLENELWVFLHVSFSQVAAVTAVNTRSLSNTETQRHQALPLHWHWTWEHDRLFRIWLMLDERHQFFLSLLVKTSHTWHSACCFAGMNLSRTFPLMFKSQTVSLKTSKSIDDAKNNNWQIANKKNH